MSSDPKDRERDEVARLALEAALRKIRAVGLCPSSEKDPIQRLINNLCLPHGFSGPTPIIARRPGAGSLGTDLFGQVWILDDGSYVWHDLEAVSW